MGLHAYLCLYIQYIDIYRMIAINIDIDVHTVDPEKCRFELCASTHMQYFYK